jgi:hypothetical protein
MRGPKEGKREHEGTIKEKRMKYRTRSRTGRERTFRWENKVAVGKEWKERE